MSVEKTDKNTGIIFASVISFCMCLLLVGFVIGSLISGKSTDKILAYACTSICYMFPILIMLIFKVKLPLLVYFVYLIFLTISAFAGTCLSLYDKINNLDKVVHFSWGYIACIIAIFILCCTKDINKLKAITLFITFFAISMATASIWEVIEFFSDEVLGQTAQGKPINGIVSVTDTMLDTICHLSGTIIFSLQFMIERILKKNLGIKSMIISFNNTFKK